MSLDIFIENPEGQRAALSQQQFDAAIALLLRLLADELKAKETYAQIVKACIDAGVPLDFK